MKPSRRVPALVLTAALGLGVWGLAFTYTPAAFSDGDVLSAAALNALLNDNFQAASDAVAGKLNLTGGTLSGPLGVSSTPADGVSTFSVENTGSSGYAALFSNVAGNATPAVAIKNFGTGSALSVTSTNGGPLFEGRSAVTDPATITIKANGTIENSVGSGLPVAYGRVASTGTRVATASTTNWTVSTDTDFIGSRYRIAIDGISFFINDFSVVVSPGASGPRFAAYSSLGGDLLVYIYDETGTRRNDTPFSFVVFKPGF